MLPYFWLFSSQDWDFQAQVLRTLIWLPQSLKHKDRVRVKGSSKSGRNFLLVVSILPVMGATRRVRYIQIQQFRPAKLYRKLSISRATSCPCHKSILWLSWMWLEIQSRWWVIRWFCWKSNWKELMKFSILNTTISCMSFSRILLRELWKYQ